MYIYIYIYVYMYMNIYIYMTVLWGELIIRTILIHHLCEISSVRDRPTSRASTS